MKVLSGIFIYPIKGLPGISLSHSFLSNTGLLHDRRWMLVSADGKFLSQRDFPQMTLFGVEPKLNGFEITGILNDSSIHIPFEILGESIQVQVWDDTMSATLAMEEYHQWFSEQLGMKIRLVYMPNHTQRITDVKYDQENNLVSFADGFPYLLIGESSLQSLNEKLLEPIKMDRFRPNLIFTGGEPFEEDAFDDFLIGEVQFKGVKPCARCQVITINQQTGIKGHEPLTTLSEFRKVGNKVLFGQNCVANFSGLNPTQIKVGDRIQIQ